MKITEERLIEILGSYDTVTNWEGDNAYQGLQIIAKYITPSTHDLIQGAGHDIIWSVNIEDIIEAGITEEDANELARLNWMIEDNSYLACFV